MMIRILYLFAFLYIAADARNVVNDINLEQRLQLINKPPIKSIHLDYATFDCIDVYKQPAFDHPLLKNHKIQLDPPRLSVEEEERVFSSQTVGSGLTHGCPDGTVPIRRTTKQDIIREQSIGDIKASYFYPNNSRDDDSVHFATLSIKKNEEFNFLGGQAYINVQQPLINPGESSGAQIWLFKTRDYGKVSSGISAGWVVDQDFYGDARTYFTASWVGGDGTGCFNLRCPGFVQVDNTVPLGHLIQDVSKYGFPQYDINTRLHRDDTTKNWWLYTGETNVAVGYWPIELFNELGEGGSYLHYGGFVRSLPNQDSPAMGSGLSEECEATHTANFANVKFRYYLDIEGRETPQDRFTTLYTDCPNYHVYHSCSSDSNRGYYFLYGGPRGNCS